MKYMGYKLVFGLVLFVALGTQQAYAHAVVQPKEVGIGEWKTFSLGVPVEKPVATVGLRLLVPSGLEYVTPTVKFGWVIEVKKDGQGEAARTTEIVWKNGSIPAGQRDDFTFSAKVPSQPGTLEWKVYQQYQDGTEVAWDHDPAQPQPTNNSKPDFSKVGPFSQTQVVNDLTKPKGDAEASKNSKTAGAALVFSIGAIVLSAFALRSVYTSRRSHSS